MDRFSGKTIIITGAGSGIGAAAARRFGQEGARVVLVGRTREKLDKVADDIPGAQVIAADVGTEDGVRAIVDGTIEAFGGIDVLVNNAGVAEPARMEDTERDAWDKTLRINLTGVYLMTQAAWPHLKKSGGNVVMTSSVSGMGGDWGMLAYNASKGGVSNFVKALALEADQSGVRVNAVAPSATMTDMASGLVENDTLYGKFKERIPLGRAADPEEVGDVIAFLASHDARFVNGVILPVDGGLSASNGQPPLG
ncbi:4-formylbenzenesulfonate dehydrogenase TsaC1/TsaC2 [Roseivivax sp. THAF40]|uniref:SDR family NAD(P)-dependent oxidoreductase n=1 Tax=Roseivivax sp. THAF40 TaxID=2587858 RepID=UPI001267D5D3|nr:SDR family oxidoreductase [Roseivivax sp. THAF40]QFT45709.1 4-formylbenzenesulfonate dehydrogenase TsaC1/TsaC2 [Roseivivax sp. THAF40]